MTILLALLLAASAAPAPIIKAPAPAAARIVTPPSPAGPSRAVSPVPLHRLISFEDYPTAALRAGEQGIVRVELDVSAEGRVTGCTITASSRSAILDSTTCRILQRRARFTPARDSTGRPVVDRFDTQIEWKISAAAAPVPPELQAAMTEWTNCIGPLLALGIADTTRTPHQVGESAFVPCTGQENRMLGAMAQALGTGGPSEKDRTAMREQVVARVEAARARKQR